ncbi:MAG TPA: nuclear transport factor 2 family protein, partial [Gammaproteobacteria bacterium]
MRHALLALTALVAGQASAAPVDSAWFHTTTQALYDAVTKGDPRPWDAAVAADCIYTSEDGLIQDKTELVKSIQPLPKGFSGGITLRDFQVRQAGDAVVTHYFSDEHEEVYGQHLKTVYVSTDTWAKRDGRWQMIATQTTVVPRDEDAVPVAAKAFAPLVGTYKVSPESPSDYVVFTRGDDLYGGRDQKTATRLIPLSPLVYFQ